MKLSPWRHGGGFVSETGYIRANGGCIVRGVARVVIDVDTMTWVADAYVLLFSTDQYTVSSSGIRYSHQERLTDFIEAKAAAEHNLQQFISQVILEL